MIIGEHVDYIRKRGSIAIHGHDHLSELMKDPVWRIYNLYVCLTKPNDLGLRERVKFIPNDAQCELLYWIFVLGRKWLNILKARQLGFTTIIQIMGLDEALNNKNANVKFLSQTEDVSKSAFREKAILAYNSLADEYVGYLKDVLDVPVATINESKIELGEGWGVFTYVNIRGGTSSMVHISELGPMAASDARRSEEAFAGAMETASVNSVVIIESTFKGGQKGIYYENTLKALDRGEEDRPKGQFWFMFFPWYEDKQYTEDDPKQKIWDSTEKYFEDMEVKTGYTFSRGQKLWWQVKADRLGGLMRQENPTTPEEAMSAPVEGAVYADILTDLEKDGRHCPIPYDPAYPVYAVWDMGMVHYTGIWLVQFRDGWIHWLRYFQDKGKQPDHYVDLVNQCGLRIQKNFLPHDAFQERAGGSWKSLLSKAGLKNIVKIEKTNNKFVGINFLQSLLKRSRFNLGDTDTGWECLMNYRQKMDDSGKIAVLRTVDDEYADGADAARYVAEALLLRKIKEDANMEKISEEYAMASGARQYRRENKSGFRNGAWWK